MKLHSLDPHYPIPSLWLEKIIDVVILLLIYKRL